MRAVVGRRASRAFLMDWERLHEDLQRAVEELQERSRHAPVIVEGEWDRRSLRALGVTIADCSANAAQMKTGYASASVIKNDERAIQGMHTASAATA